MYCTNKQSLSVTDALTHLVLYNFEGKKIVTFEIKMLACVFVSQIDFIYVVMGIIC